jgi:hypothetical protein
MLRGGSNAGSDDFLSSGIARSAFVTSAMTLRRFGDARDER